MDKLTMAHQWAIELLRAGDHSDDVISCAWRYADAMQAEANEREKVEKETKRKEIRELLNANNTFIEKEGQHFDDVEWHPDWSQAPDGFDWFVAWADKNGIIGGGFFYSAEPEPSPFKNHLGSCWIGRNCESIETGSFGYIGNWQDSLRKRP